MTTNPKRPYYRKDSGPEETTEGHESYGLVSIHKTSGGGNRLFGSHLENQSHYFTLRVEQAEVIHSLSQDWYHPRGQLIEVHMTAAQFVEMITNMNMGSGIPCTVHRVLGDTMEPLPQTTETEAKKIRTSFKEKLKSLVTSLTDKSEKVDVLLEKKSLTVADKNEVKNILRTAIREVGSNLPFVLDSFQESTEKMVSNAKTEIDSFMALGLQRLGLDTMHKRISSGKSPLPALEADTEDED